MFALLRSLALRFFAPFRSDILDRRLDEEIRFHMAMLGEANTRRGMNVQEASFEARRLFGSGDLIKEQYRDQRGFCFETAIFADVKIAIAMLRRNRSFAFGVGTTLSLSVAATVIVISMVNAAMLRPLPYPDSSGIFEITKARSGRLDDGHSHSSFAALRARNRSFATLAAFEYGHSRFYVDEIGEHVRAVSVSFGYFEMLRIAPLLGRTFRQEDEQIGAADAVILSHHLWLTKFGGDARVIGSPISLNGIRHTVVGVAPAYFRGLPETDLWIPLRPVIGSKANTCFLIARLKPGVTPDSAQRDVERINAQLGENLPGPGGTHLVRVRRMHDVLAQRARPICLLLLLAIALVHLITCLNTANLVLTRAFAHARDTAVRIALGAGRYRIVQLCMIESMILAFVSGAAGFIAARIMLPLLANTFGFQTWNDVSMDPIVLYASVFLVIGSGLIAGLLPALLISRVDPNSAIKEGSWNSSRSRSSVSTAMIASELALCVLLLMGAGLLIRSLVLMLNVDPGFNPKQLVTAKLSARSDAASASIDLPECLRALDRLQRSRGVRGAAIVSSLPSERGVNIPVVIPRRAGEIHGGDIYAGEIHEVQWRYVTPDYFRLMQIQILGGRAFRESDTSRSAPVAIVNRQFALLELKSQNAVGKQILLGGVPSLQSDPRFHDQVRKIVGIVSDVAERGFMRPFPPTVYVPALQVSKDMFLYANETFPMRWIARMEAPVELMESFKNSLVTADLRLHFTDLSRMEEVLARSLEEYRLLTLAISGFAAFALVISITGIYTVVSHSVIQRKRELAVNLALGASARRLLISIASRGALLGAVGVTLGIPAWLVIKGLLSAFVLGISTHDPLTLLAVALLLPLLAALASVIPASRVNRIDAAVILRSE